VRRLLLAVFLSALSAPLLHAQHATAGGSYAVVSLEYPDQIPNGFGGWYTWDLAANAGPTVGVDLGLNFFPEDHPIIGRQTQLFAGARGGLRYERLGIFGRLRPGIMHFSRQFLAPDTACVAIFPPPDDCLTRNANLTFDLGGTLEVYALDRFVVRADLGQTLIRFRRVGRDAVVQRNLQFTAGAGLRF